MNDCTNGGRNVYEPSHRVDIQIHFTDEDELEFNLPLDLKQREISHFTVDDDRYEKVDE